MTNAPAMRLSVTRYDMIGNCIETARTDGDWVRYEDYLDETLALTARAVGAELNLAALEQALRERDAVIAAGREGYGVFDEQAGLWGGVVGNDKTAFDEAPPNRVVRVRVIVLPSPPEGE